jgi:hypothetical protein
MREMLPDLRWARLMSRRVPSGPKPVAAGSRGGELEGVMATDSKGTERSRADSVGNRGGGVEEAAIEVAASDERGSGCGSSFEGPVCPVAPLPGAPRWTSAQRVPADD